MKSQIYTRLASFALLFSLIFVVTNVTAKKPPQPPPTGVPCASLQTPDIAFWRDSRTNGKNRMAQVAIYVAESATGCETKLLDIPLPGGPINDLKLAYSSDQSDGEFIGRVVWAVQVTGRAQSIWKYDFTIEEGQAVALDEPTMILNLGDAGKSLDINDLDLSPDMTSLVYLLMEYRDTEPNYVSIHTLEIADCVDPACPFGFGKERYVMEKWPNTFEALYSPVWGPLGSRIYFIERDDSAHYVKFIDVSSQTEPETLFSYGVEEHIFQVSSGIEYIALEIGTDPFIHGCRSIYTLNVSNCESFQNCELQREFAGIWPSWTRNGELIHTYQGLTLKQTCSTNTIGSWDGTNLEILMKGYEPEAAGG